MVNAISDISIGENRPDASWSSQLSIFDFLIAVDVIAVSLWLSERITLPGLIGLHLGAALFFLACHVLFLRSTSHLFFVEAALYVLAGPIGTVVMRIASLTPTSTAADVERMILLDASEPPGLADAIFEAHLQGRRSVRTEVQAQSYVDMLRGGDLSCHNEVIAAISRNYEPKMYPALSAALGSSSPALKVQAAAVYSKLRRTFGETANELLKLDLNGLTRDEAAAYHADFLRVAHSGFLDADRSHALIKRASEIAASGLHEANHIQSFKPFGRVIASFRQDVRKPGPRLKRYSCGGLG